METSVSNVFAAKAPPTILLDGIAPSAKFAVSVPETEASPVTCNPAFALSRPLLTAAPATVNPPFIVEVPPTVNPPFIVEVPLTVNPPFIVVAFATLSVSLRLTSPCAFMPFIEISVLNVLAAKAPPLILLDGIAPSKKLPLNVPAVNVPATLTSPVIVAFTALNVPLLINAPLVVTAPATTKPAFIDTSLSNVGVAST